MNTKKPILIVAGEPFSIFSEILFKSFLKYKIKRPLVVLASIKLFKSQMNYLNYNIPFNVIDKKFDISELRINKINIINIDFNFSKPFKKISKDSNLYNKKSFELALYLLKKKIFLGLINGPISKKHFLKKNFPGITEYLAKKTNTKNFAMLIYNKKLIEQDINIDQEINKMIDYEMNKQLNNLSTIHYNKVKANLIINEY